jgi:hypothetical protein
MVNNRMGREGRIIPLENAAKGGVSTTGLGMEEDLGPHLATTLVTTGTVLIVVGRRQGVDNSSTTAKI